MRTMTSADFGILSPSFVPVAPKSKAPARGGTVLARVRSEAAINGLLGGRPRDERVKYFTHVNAGRSYPYSSKRQMGRSLA